METVELVKEFIEKNKLDAVVRIHEPESTKTSKSAAQALGCSVAEIAKTVAFLESSDGKENSLLVVLSGEKRVNTTALSRLLEAQNGQIRKMSAEEVKVKTGYSIGGLAPFPHKDDVRTLVDRSLFSYQKVWAAAGSSNAVMGFDPKLLTEKLHLQLVDVSE